MANVYYPPVDAPVVGKDDRVTVVWRNYFQTLTGGITPGGGPGITVLTGPVTTPGGGGAQPTTITPTGVTPGTYGDALNVSQITVNAAGQITAAANVSISGGGGGSWIPLVDGSEPPVFLTDGAGVLMLVAYP